MLDFLSIALTGLLSSWLTYFFGIRKLRTETELRLKAERYEKLIQYLRGFVGASASGDKKKEFFSEFEKSWLYCSDEVYKSINRMAEHVKSTESKETYKETGEGYSLLGEVIIAMRKDLFNKKTSLKNVDFVFWNVIDK